MMRIVRLLLGFYTMYALLGGLVKLISSPNGNPTLLEGDAGGKPSLVVYPVIIE